MRSFLPLLVMLCGCGPDLVFRDSAKSPQDLERQASLVVVGVIEEQEFDRFVRPSMPRPYWWYLRRRVRVELVLKGAKRERALDVWEIHWVGGSTGDWNSTRVGERALFLLCVENGRYRLVRDWARNIFPVTSGAHDRAPLSETAPLWERVALLNWWFAEKRTGGADLSYADPGGVLGRWRTMKLARGLVRHPLSKVRVQGCLKLLNMGGWGLDECWEQLTA